MALFHLLDFGSGFDSMLLAKTGKGALGCCLPPAGGAWVLGSCGRLAGRPRRLAGRPAVGPTAPMLVFAPRSPPSQACPACPGPLPPPAPLPHRSADARETAQFGLLGMLMGGAHIESAAWLREFSSYQVFQFFNIDASGGEG